MPYAVPTDNQGIGAPVTGPAATAPWSVTDDTVKFNQEELLLKQIDYLRRIVFGLGSLAGDDFLNVDLPEDPEG